MSGHELTYYTIDPYPYRKPIAFIVTFNRESGIYPLSHRVSVKGDLVAAFKCACEYGDSMIKALAV